MWNYGTVQITFNRIQHDGWGKPWSTDHNNPPAYITLHTQQNLWSWPHLQVGHLSQLATLLYNRLIPMLYMIITPYFTRVPWILTNSHFMLCFVHISYILIQVLCQTVHWPKFSFIACSISILSPQVWTTDKNSLVATVTLLYLKLLIIDRICIVYTFKLDPLSLHSELYICPGDPAQSNFHSATRLP
jgi:hypothetical protein